MTKLYYLLNSERYPGEDSTREWSSHFKKTMQCRCGNVKREAHLEIDLDDDPIGLPINVVNFGPCGIIRNDCPGSIARSRCTIVDHGKCERARQTFAGLYGLSPNT